MISYDVFYNGAAVGKVDIEKQGLYYRVQCHCKKMDGIFRLTDQCEKGNVVIGVCIPDDNGMVITKCIPVKQLGDGPHLFVLIGNGDAQERFAPLDEELPTECLRSLELARFAVRNGRAGLLY